MWTGTDMATGQSHSKTSVGAMADINSTTGAKTVAEACTTAVTSNGTEYAMADASLYASSDSEMALPSTRPTLPGLEPLSDDDSGDMADIDTDASSEAGAVPAPIGPALPDSSRPPAPRQEEGGGTVGIPHAHTWYRTPLTRSALRLLEFEFEDENSDGEEGDGKEVSMVICCTTCQEPVNDGIWRCQHKACAGMFCDACYFSSGSGRRPVWSEIENDEEL
ncbi:hypothetical protein FGG08_003782 [Glutinoglossum americanum]|uniref:Uncharacterized protein n=1 Tax=Glutinoglossum americanum TaxID=1670608 RepID=A0A9P8I1Y5_9PEZI|nr:hypothetical protein FGG08_003782 [Glutinoglossum americanum]